MGDKSQKDKSKGRKQKARKAAIKEEKRQSKQDHSPVSGLLKK